MLGAFQGSIYANSNSLHQSKMSLTYFNECSEEIQAYGRELLLYEWSYSSLTLYSPHHQRSSQWLLLTHRGKTDNRGGCWGWSDSGGEGREKLKGKGGRAWERSRETEAEGERDREGEGAVPRAATALPPNSHPCVTSPCCKLGYTCSMEMSEHISWLLAWICIGARWSFFIQQDYLMLQLEIWAFQ